MCTPTKFFYSFSFMFVLSKANVPVYVDNIYVRVERDHKGSPIDIQYDWWSLFSCIFLLIKSEGG